MTRMRRISFIVLAALTLLLPLGCGTLAPPAPPELPGQAVSPARRFVVATLTRATIADEVFDGASVQTLDAADLAVGAIADAVTQRFVDGGGSGSSGTSSFASGLIAGAVSGLISTQRIEAKGARVWEVSVKGDPPGTTRWFIVRPAVRGSADVPTLPANQPVRIYANRVELPGFSALLVTRWSKL